MMPSHPSERLGIAPSSILGFGMLLPFPRIMSSWSAFLAYCSSSCCQFDILLRVFVWMVVLADVVLALSDAFAATNKQKRRARALLTDIFDGIQHQRCNLRTALR
ncbi:hypothetical protein CCUS01_11767 [Colletotrichum cuscutae]|uniref:Uncharacterized protein n=2 Tax=Colletotrichum acutatum species complex TaxID=2707335 RepID=A0AAI9U116_9PEZI|nr:hypothetical protein CCUS01_11767 [Colletotrichum cuscutae]